MRTLGDFPWEDYLAGKEVPEDEMKYLCSTLMTTEEKMSELIQKHFTVADYYKVWKQRIGGGRIGGKACGLLMARKLIETKMPQGAEYMIDHHSFFIGTQVFDDFLIENDCMDLWMLDRTKKEYARENEELRERISAGEFPREIRQKLADTLEDYGNTPIIVRSSSFLEDGFGNSFSGKYESIFCVNQGSPQECLAELENAIKLVYASTTNPSAIEYRRRRHLASVDEKMAILLQRVEGQSYGDFYMPVAAGMGCSYNPYKWMENMNPDAGMIRMVLGLGTRAVERTPGDYPRLFCLDRAQANLHTTLAERHKFSQRKVDVLDYETNTLKTLPLNKVAEKLPKWQKRLALTYDTEAEERLRERGRYQRVFFADCQGMVSNIKFVRLMSDILKMLEKEYGSPVDIEFAVSSPKENEIKVNIYQCRPIQSTASQEVVIPKGIDHQILFDVRRTSMRRSKVEDVDLIVWVDPLKYYQYPYSRKPDVARMISAINEHFAESGKKMALLVPGRIGTSSPELGVPVVYADISEFGIICEVAYGKAGYHPDLSYGSHMFQDLVEADVYYGALNENSKTRIYRPEMLEQFKDIFPEIWPGEEELSQIVKIYDVSQQGGQLMLDMKAGRAVCRFRNLT